VESLFNAMQNIVPSHLMDRKQYDFTSLKATGVADAGGDIAFDEEPCAPSGAQSVQWLSGSLAN
jgi:tRNA 2-thiocytidine biosynthesis protein TtcA